MASRRALHLLTASRGISSTPHLASLGWFDKIKSTFTGKKPDAASEADSFTLLKFADSIFADSIETARKLGKLKNFVSGRTSEATAASAFEKHSSVLRYLGAIDPTGQKLQNSDKINASKHCNCTIADVEHILAKYTWAKEAQRELVKLKEEGKPLPKTFNEIQKVVGSTPMDIGQSNLAKSGQISRNALCPCGSKKRYKRFDASRTSSITKQPCRFLIDDLSGAVELHEVNNHAFICLHMTKGVMKESFLAI